MFKNGAHLFESDAGKPLDELRDWSPVFEIFKERRDGHTTTAKHPSTAITLGIALDSLAGGPVNHGRIIAFAG